MKLVALEGKRAQNIVIGLSQYKSFGSYSILLSAICSLDNLNGTLTLDHAENLVSLLPTVSELKKVVDMSQSKHPAELFFLLAKDFYPELPRRLNCFIMTQHFENYCLATENKMKALNAACSEVVSNQNLSRVLQKMLAIGNVMNQGTNRAATGVTLDSLLKMVNTKGVDKKTSILDYVVKNIIDKGEERLLSVSKDLAVIDDASRLSSKDIVKEIELIKKNLDGMEDELKKCADQLH
jgi:formin 2